ncbi:unnamed protein product [Ilex paraguariensis]|uniref:Uncharacterized protein n=1 Tax=Ilex paraguariensis TaxID=185542 RepID=A0ABC8RZ88_9AQUA
MLSYAGRATLIRSTALAIPVYVMMSFQLPKTMCNIIDKKVHNFWLHYSKHGLFTTILANSIWKWRNRILFQQILPDPQQILHEILQTFEEFMALSENNRTSDTNPTVSLHQNKWKAP